MADALLVAQYLTRRFGALVAVDNVSLQLRYGELHAVLGPNGAGKSTLINLLSGDMAPSSGVIEYKGRDITALSAHQRAQLGIGRSYQRTNIFPSFTAFENCRLAAQSRDPRALAVWSDARRHCTAAAERVLETVGLPHRGDALAGELSHGEQRQLEVAMALATAPAVLLLDEPLAGVGREESVRLTKLLRRLAADHAVMLVEHDLDAVFAVADVVTVMANGQVLESGDPDRVRSSAVVRQVYLGDGMSQ